MFPKYLLFNFDLASTLIPNEESQKSGPDSVLNFRVGCNLCKT